MNFAEALQQLAAWERHHVTVRAYSQPWQQLLAHAHTAMHGRLGPARLGAVHGPVSIETALFALGPARQGDSPQNGFMLRSDDFVGAVQLNAGHLDVECGNGFHIEIQRD